MTSLFSARLRLLRRLVKSPQFQSALDLDPKLARSFLNAALRAHGYNNFQSLDESGEAEFVQRISSLNATSVGIDVGANSGDYSRLLLQSGFSRVLAVEPHPENAGALTSLQIEHPTAFHWLGLACGVTRGHATLFFRAEALAHASLLSEMNEIDYVQNQATVLVEVERLDDIVESESIDTIDLLKIDVEGFETQVLMGASRVLSEIRPRFVQIENNLHQLVAGQSLNSLTRHMPDYAVVQLLPNARGARRINPVSLDANIFAFSNFVFVRDPADLPILLGPSRVERQRRANVTGGGD